MVQSKHRVPMHKLNRQPNVCLSPETRINGWLQILLLYCTNMDFKMVYYDIISCNGLTELIFTARNGISLQINTSTVCMLHIIIIIIRSVAIIWLGTCCHYIWCLLMIVFRCDYVIDMKYDVIVLTLHFAEHKLFVVMLIFPVFYNDV